MNGALMNPAKMTLVLVFLIINIFLSGCAGGLEGLAQRILYPAEQVNKKYPVQEVPPEGLYDIWFELLDEKNEPYKVHSWLYRNPEPTSNTIVYFHGNGENLQTMHLFGFLGALKSLKTSFLVVDYPSYGRSTGKPSQKTLVDSAIAAIDFARENLNGKIHVWGRSMGASVAIHAYSKSPEGLDKLVLTSPWTNFYDVAISVSKLAKQVPKGWLARNSYDSFKEVKNVKASVLIHHGNIDELIEFKQGKKVAGKFNEESEVNFVEVVGRGHNDIFSEQSLWQEVFDFVK